MSRPNWRNVLLNQMKDTPLTELPSDTEPQEGPDDDLRARIDRLETEGKEVHRRTERRIILAELKVEAMRAGMIDLDCLTFVDLTKVHLGEDGDVAGGAELIGQLKHSKPWLFVPPSSSSVARVPLSRPVRQKLATEMTNEEYRIARANIIKRSAL
jgi:hypothetical protein